MLGQMSMSLPHMKEKDGSLIKVKEQNHTKAKLDQLLRSPSPPLLVDQVLRLRQLSFKNFSLLFQPDIKTNADLIDSIYEGSVKSTAMSKDEDALLSTNLLFNWGDFHPHLKAFTKRGETFLTKGVGFSH